MQFTKVRFTIHLEPEEVAAIKVEASIRGVHVTDLIAPIILADPAIKARIEWVRRQPEFEELAQDTPLDSFG